MLLSIFCFLLAASRFILQTNVPEDLHLQRWSLSCYFHDEINCSNNWFVNETIDQKKKKKLYQGLNGFSVGFLLGQPFQESAIVKRSSEINMCQSQFLLIIIQILGVIRSQYLENAFINKYWARTK